MDYNSTVSKLRELARDTLRLHRVNQLRSERLPVDVGLSQEVKQAETLIAKCKHDIAVAEFNMTQVNDADPNKVTKLERLTEQVVQLNKAIENEKANLPVTVESYKKRLEEFDKAIANVQSGDWKVCAELLEEATSTLINEVSAEASKNVPLAEASA